MQAFPRELSCLCGQSDLLHPLHNCLQRPLEIFESELPHPVEHKSLRHISRSRFAGKSARATQPSPPNWLLVEAYNFRFAVVRSFAVMEKATQHELRLARRMSRLGTETAFEVLNKARTLEREGKSIIHLEIGEPDFDTPLNVVEAGVDALRKGWTHYGPSAGLADLRQTLAEYVSRTRAVKVTSDEVVVVPGGKPIIFFTILALIEEGDEVIYPNPGFPIYESMIHYAGGRAIPIHLREDRDFSLDVDELASIINDRTKLIILNSPQNPTGGVLERKEIEQIAKIIGDQNIMVLSDEIYSRLLFDGGQHFSIMSVPGMQERTILLDGFSKTYAMTGWRMGYGVMRTDLAAHITRLMTNSNSCTASFTQVAGIEAIRGDQSSVDRMRSEFQRRRDVFVAGLNKIKGFSCRMPKGAFYVFPNITGTGWRSKPLADALLEQAGVAALSGTAFGEFGEGYLRFSVANSLENLEQALDRVDSWTKTNL
jgi:aspartate aminotransferase